MRETRRHAAVRAACVAAVLAAGAWFASALGSTTIEPQGPQAAMTRLLSDEGLVGAAWATVWPDSTVTGAAGLADARRGTPLRADHRIQVGSVAKTLVAAGILRLVTQGRLALDAPLGSLLPDVAIDNPWAATDTLRVRHLLDHTSGLDDLRLWQIFSLEARADTPLRAGLGRTAAPLHLRTRPGSRFSYSNTGYTLAGMVIEAVTGERYDAHLDAHLLRPLGMSHSTFRFVTQTGPDADTLMAMGHFEGGATQAAVPSYMRVAGQFTTTAADMARFAVFLMSDGRVAGERFIDSTLLRAMGRPVGTEAAAAGLEAGYGLGLSRRDRHGVIGLCHDGNGVGFRAMLCVFPGERKAFFVAQNADAENARYGRFDSLLIATLGIAPARPAEAAPAPAGVEDWDGIYVPAPSRMSMFAYVDVVSRFVRVEWDGTVLHLRPFQATARRLTPVGGMLLRANDRAVASHVLLTPSDGARVISDGLRSHERIARWRIGLLCASLAAGAGGLLVILLGGLARLPFRSLRPPALPDVVPLAAVAALLLPIPFFMGQPFLRLGDLTAASALLALATGALPLAMLFGLWRHWRRRPPGRLALLDAAAMLAVLQWAVVLAAWGLLPLRLWA